MTYEFYITTASSVSYQVYPLNWLECSLVDGKEKGQVYYRRKFEGSLTFGGQKLCDDFDIFYGIEQFDPCGLVYLFILRNGSSYWEGYFSTSMGEWDLDNQTFTVTPLVLDDYTVFDDEGDIQYSILTQTAYTVNMTYKGVDYRFDRCRKLMDFIEYVANQICGATVTSSFLNDVANYVTLGDNHYNMLYIAQKSDIKRWESSDAATVADMSWNELMNLLKTMNLAWTYDESTNVVTIEHVSYFTAAAGLDIRTQEIAYRNNKYTYTKESLPKYEKYRWMEAGKDEFIEGVIWYDSLCVNQNPESNIKEYQWNTTTDIEYICDCIANPDLISNISDDGFVLLACYEDGGDLYIYQTNRPSNNIYFNCDLGWGILFLALFKHERMQMEGYMNGILTDFYSAVKFKRQLTNIIDCDVFDPNAYITTELGEDYFYGAKGYVETASLSPDGSIALKLLYGEPENPNTGFSYGKGMVITEVKTEFPDTTTYTAVLTEPADADLKLQIRLVIQDDTYAVCVTAYFDLDIATGLSTGSVAIPWCDPGGSANWRIYIHHWVDAGLLDWDWTVVYDPDVFIF
jgi:hypothetical protein